MYTKNKNIKQGNTFFFLFLLFTNDLIMCINYVSNILFVDCHSVRLLNNIDFSSNTQVIIISCNMKGLAVRQMMR